MIKKLLAFGLIILFISSPAFIPQLSSKQRIIIYVSDDSVSQISHEFQDNSLINSRLQNQLKLEAIDVLNHISNSGIEYQLVDILVFGIHAIILDIDASDLQKTIILFPDKKIFPDEILNIQLDKSSELIKATYVQNFTFDNGKKLTGNNITIAIIDTGINYNHSSLGGGFGSGYKVIGGYDFVDNDDDPFDEHGHGTHIAGIIASTVYVKGISPNVDLLAYRVVGYNGLVQASDVIMAMNRAVIDGSDIINLSLGSMSESNNLRKTIKEISKSGTIIVAAVGNSGPISGSIGDPGRYEDVISVGSQYNARNSTLGVVRLPDIHEEIFGLPMRDSVLSKTPLTGEFVFVNYARLQDVSDLDLNGKIAIALRRGAEPNEIVYFSTKEATVSSKGALGLIIINTIPGIVHGQLIHPNSPPEYKPTIPTILITQEDGQIILDALQNRQLLGTVDIKTGLFTNLISLFSSRGPVSSFYIKPDIIAPGENINSTWLQNSFMIQNGTSFAAPHVTAAIALLLELHGPLTNDEILGILGPSSTTLTNSFDKPWSVNIQGSGSLNLQTALQNPVIISPSKLSFNLANQNKEYTKIIKIKSIVDEPLDIFIDDNVSLGSNVDFMFNLSHINLTNKQEIAIELHVKLNNEIIEPHSFETRLIITTNSTKLMKLTIPIIVHFNDISINITKLDDNYEITQHGIDNYDEIFYQIYRLEDGHTFDKTFSYGEPTIFTLEQGHYLIDVIISHNNTLSYGGIEFDTSQHVNPITTDLQQPLDSVMFRNLMILALISSLIFLFILILIKK